MAVASVALAVLATAPSARAQMHRPGGGMGMGMHGGGMSAGARSPFPVTAQSIAAGQALFAVYCTACHGPHGLGDGPAAAAFNPPPADLHAPMHMRPPGYAYQVLTQGFNRMPSFVRLLGETERWQLAHYVDTLRSR